MNNAFLIGAATSNSGKTTFTMGLLRALRNRGMNVQPYKCGPDYIDTMFHHIASGNESVNLDSFMASSEHVKEVFHKHGARADAQIVEGVMGLFDGYDKSRGSSAEIAMTLDIPVVLIVNAKSVAYSVAPLIYGFKHFNPQLKIAGVVFNMVASESHFRFLKDACRDAGVRCLGYMQKNQELTIPGRHLGLTISAKAETEQLIDIAAKEIEKHVDLEFFCSPKESLAAQSELTLHPDSNSLMQNEKENALSIAIAQDEAFNFTYKANIDALRKLGNVCFFSPLRDAALPKCDLLYLPGGYPELFADQLSANESMRQSIKEFADKGGRIFAECGGFMYLTRSIDGVPMCDVFPMEATMQNAHLHLGYRTMQWKGITVKGHEFHYSEIKQQELPDSITIEHCQSSAKGTPVSTAVYRYRNVVAGYTHWYWAEIGASYLINL